MKKIIIIIGLCAVLISMPAITAIPTMEASKTFVTTEKGTTLQTPTLDDYDGTFIGGLGRLYKEDGEWQFNHYSYLAGVYKLGRFNKLYGYIYNLEEEQIGEIGAYFGHKLILGFIGDLDGNRLPMIGFLIYNDVNFAGRIMSLVGPAPHIIGEYIPNE